MTKQSLSLRTVLSTSAFCAALVAAPIVNGLLSGSAYALEDDMINNCTNAVLTKLGTTQDKLESLKVTKNDLTDAVNSAKKLPDYNKYATVFDEYLELIWSDEYMDALTDSDLDASTTSQKSVATELTTAMSSAGFTTTSETSAIESFIATEQNPEDAGLLNTVYNMWKQANPDWTKYYDIYAAIAPVENNIHGGYVPDYTDADLFLGIVCSATKFHSNFVVDYATGSNPFIATSTDDNTGTDTTISSTDQTIRVSGSSIDPSYTLAVDAIKAEELKLTGSNFVNKKNQAFYDIYIHDDQNNIISNAGKVTVSIKLPSSMDLKNDFIVYYIPVAANGEYLTDQAKAIKGATISADGWITFETDHFSVYGVVEYPKGKYPGAPDTGAAPVNGNDFAGSTKLFANLATVLTTVGAAIVIRRQLLRSEAAANQD